MKTFEFITLVFWYQVVELLGPNHMEALGTSPTHEPTKEVLHYDPSHSYFS